MSSMPRWVRVWGFGFGFLVLSCVTINVYFPTAQVEAAAEQIVEEVYDADVAPPGPTSHRWSGWRLFGAQAAYAQVNIDVSTPAIRALRRHLDARHEKLLPFYERGALGINRAGYLEVRDASGLSLKDKGTLTKLVQAENAERRTLYREIVIANSLEPGDVAEVERIFADQWRAHARPGWWVQNDKGAWEKKPAQAP